MFLGQLYNTIEPIIASELMGYDTSRKLWNAANELFGVKTRSIVEFQTLDFAKMHKGSLKMKEYLKAMKGLADNLTLAGHHVCLYDLFTQILTGLDFQEYYPLVCQIIEKDDISWVKLQSKLMSYKKRLEQLNVGIGTINLGNPTAHYMKSNNYSNKNQNQYYSRG